MARYFKVNPKVAQHLGVEDKRNVLKDGNYLLWQADLRAFGSLVEYKSICERIGAIALLPYEARQEQDGVLTRSLPIATDPQFVVEDNAANTPQAEVDEQPETDDETGAESETDNDPEPETESDPTDEAITDDQHQSEETENTNLSDEEQ